MTSQFKYTEVKLSFATLAVQNKEAAESKKVDLSKLKRLVLKQKHAKKMECEMGGKKIQQAVKKPKKPQQIMPKKSTKLKTFKKLISPPSLQNTHKHKIYLLVK